MRELVRTSVTAAAAMVSVAALGITTPASTASAAVTAQVRLSAATTPNATVPNTISPPLGAPLVQFVANQFQNCSLICPYLVQGAVQVPASVVGLPLTFVEELQSGKPLLQSIALTAATVSGAVNDAYTGIIVTDLGQVVPRAQHGTEVIAVGLIDITSAAITRPADLPQAILNARADLFGALTKAPGPEPPATAHNAVEVAAVRALEVGWTVAFYVPERVSLGVTQAANAFLVSLGNTGNFGSAANAAGTSLAAAVSDAVGAVQHAVTVPIPTAPAATTVNPAAKPTPQPAVSATSAAVNKNPKRTPATVTHPTPSTPRSGLRISGAPTAAASPHTTLPTDKPADSIKKTTPTAGHAATHQGRNGATAKPGHIKKR